MIEPLANYAHDAWSRWMSYLFKQCRSELDGSVVIPKWAVERWIIQMNTSYSNLSDREKDSDRAEANEMIKIMEEHK